jgi:hypothetical protein
MAMQKITSDTSTGIPHWATAVVSNYRASAKIAADVSDERIYELWNELSGMEQDDVLQIMRETLGDLAG